MTSPGTFTCERCGGQFLKGRPDAEAMDEALDLYPVGDLADGTAVVCDDCFNEVTAWARTNAPGLLRDAQ